MWVDLLEARKRQISQQYHHARKIAARQGEPFRITHREWIGMWQCQDDPLEPGRIIRANAGKPWSPSNCRFETRHMPRNTLVIHPGVRVLTIQQWVQELRAQG